MGLVADRIPGSPRRPTVDDRSGHGIASGEGGWKVTVAGPTSSQGWFTGSWGVKVPGAVLLRALKLRKAGGTSKMVTVFVPRTDTESVPVVIDDRGVSITRNGRTVTTPLPVG